MSSNINVTNVDSGSVLLEKWGEVDKTLVNSEIVETVFLAGTLLALHATDGKLYPYDPAALTENINVPKYVLTYDVTVAASSDLAVMALSAGKVNQNRLRLQGGGPVTAAILDQLLDRPIIPVAVAQLCVIDNPQS
jgi:hypothetical protein